MERLKDGARPTTRVCEAVGGPLELKNCTACLEMKPRGAFAQDRRALGIQVPCKACQSVARRASRRQEPDVWRARSLQTRYGISTADYDAMGAAQGWVCAICSTKGEERLHIDHDHATKKVRALLCGTCNRALGMMKDRPELLRAAAAYLELHHRE